MKMTAMTRKRTTAAAGTEPMLKREVEEFLYHQAELLDGKRWQEYIDLFAADGIYWMPADPGHTHWEGLPSIFTEDTHLMTVRMKRILHPDAWSQKALWETSHVIGNVRILERPAPAELLVQSRFHMMEQRRDNGRHFAGRYRHHLVRDGNAWRIKLQRVDLVNAQAAFDYVLQAWV
jgi:3-phenylpropionate/cinnamic acid dioxygenase small subunit